MRRARCQHGSVDSITFLVGNDRNERFACLRVVLEHLEFRLESDSTALWFVRYRQGKPVQRLDLVLDNHRFELKVTQLSWLAARTPLDLQSVREWVLKGAGFQGLSQPDPPFPPIESYYSPYPRPLDHSSSTEKTRVAVSFKPELVGAHRQHRFQAPRDERVVLSRIRAFADYLGYQEVHGDGELLFVRGDQPGSLELPNIGLWRAELHVKVKYITQEYTDVSMDRKISYLLLPTEFSQVAQVLEQELVQMRAFVAIGSHPLANLPRTYADIRIRPHSTQVWLTRAAFASLGITGLATVIASVVGAPLFSVYSFVGFLAVSAIFGMKFSTREQDESVPHIDPTMFLDRSPPNAG